MLIQSSTILTLPVAATDSQSLIGHVKQIIIDPQNGELLGFIVKPAGIFAKDKILSRQDIIEIDRNGIVTKSEENLLEPDEVVRINKIINSNIKIIGQNAYTESKKNLGKINDLIIDTEKQIIDKYYVHSMFEEKILPHYKVVKINERGVFFSDDVIEQTPAAEVEGAAA
jgi:uncharacterized protein YrrD